MQGCLIRSTAKQWDYSVSVISYTGFIIQLKNISKSPRGWAAGARMMSTLCLDRWQRRTYVFNSHMYLIIKDLFNDFTFFINLVVNRLQYSVTSIGRNLICCFEIIFVGLAWKMHILAAKGFDIWLVKMGSDINETAVGTSRSTDRNGSDAVLTVSTSTVCII